MNRRGFLGSLAAFAAACTVDPELGLWKPGAKLISIPKPRRLKIGDTIQVRRPQRFIARQGQAFQPQSIVPQFESLTISDHAMLAKYRDFESMFA